MAEIGHASAQIAAANASEGRAGNISLCMGETDDFERIFPLSEHIELPFAVSSLADKWCLVTGSGCRLRDVGIDPLSHLGLLRISEGGCEGTFYTSAGRKFRRPTSEFGSHLAIHEREMQKDGTKINAVVHAHPFYLTYLTSIPLYQDRDQLSRAVLRWQAEFVVNLPRGLGYIPFLVPNSDALVRATHEIAGRYNLIVWGKHGALAVSNESVIAALDLMEYAEVGARCEYANLSVGKAGHGMTEEEIRSVYEHFGLGEVFFHPGP